MIGIISSMLSMTTRQKSVSFRSRSEIMWIYFSRLRRSSPVNAVPLFSCGSCSRSAPDRCGRITSLETLRYPDMELFPKALPLTALLNA